MISDARTWGWLIGIFISTGFLPAILTVIGKRILRKYEESRQREREEERVEKLAEREEARKEHEEEMRIAARRQEKEDAMCLGMKQILHNDIFQVATQSLHQGYITSDARENFDRLVEPYFILGGNGTGHAMAEQVKKLPIRDPDYTLEKYER